MFGLYTSQNLGFVCGLKDVLQFLLIPTSYIHHYLKGNYPKQEILFVMDVVVYLYLYSMTSIEVYDRERKTQKDIQKNYLGGL